MHYLQLHTRIFVTRPEEGLNAFGAFQCKMPIKGVVTEAVTLKLPPPDEAELESETPYIAVSYGDEVELKVTVKKILNKVIRWKLNNKDLGPSWLNQTYMKLTNVNVTHSGIYEAYYAGRRNESVHALMRLIVRGCAAELFGDDCDKDCPSCYNGGICHDKWGVCVCPPGFTGEYCEKACGGNHFGDDCGKYCTPPQNNTNMEDGCALFTFCKPDPYGCSCASGFKGHACMEQCESGWYGADCHQPCHCAYGVKACHRITGFCDGGCADGWRGDSCQISDPAATAGSLLETTTMTSCPLGKYGAQCEKNCHCADTLPCDVVNGQCPSICETGWSGLSCSVCGKGQFGDNCEFFCHCAGGPDMCDKEGYCFNGCDAGWAGFTCQQECTDGRFGHNCASTCHCFADSDTCNKVTGECSGDCQAGFKGNNCQTLCSSNNYGINCRHACSCLNGGLCNRVDGTCACEGRWRGQVCNESMPEIIATTDEEANIGQLAFISCTADAVPPPEMNLASVYFPGLPFNLRALDKNQFQAVMKIVPDKAGEFNFSCSAKNSHGFDRKIIIFSAIAPPELIDPPEVTEETNSSITVKWEPWLYGKDSGGKPDDNVEYMVLYKESGKLDWQQHGGWTIDHAATIRNLLPYQNYEISVKCKRPNKGGEGGPGPYVLSKTLCGEPLANAIPHHFLPDEMSPDFVRLTWKNPAESLLKCKLIGYHLLYFPDSDGSSENSTGLNTLSINTVTTEVTLEDIPPNSLYKFHLYPVTTMGRFQYYAELTFRTSELVPGPVIDLEYELTEDTDMLLIKWNNPIIRNGLIKTYNVTYELINRGHCGKSAQAIDAPNVFSIVTSETKVVIVDVVPYSTYSITVAAQTASGEGDPSSIAVMTMQAAPDIGPPNIHASEITSTSIEFKWDPIPCESANGPIIEYEYNLVTSSLSLQDRTKRAADVNMGFNFIKVKGLKALVTGLEPSMEYGFAVRGYTRIDAGPFTDFVFATTKDGVPLPPEQLIIDSVTSNLIMVSWLKPNSFTGEIQSYRIRYQPAKDLEHYTDVVFNTTEKETTSKNIFGTITNLRGAVNYVLKIQACSVSGCGNWSKELLGRTRDGVPGPPVELTLIDCSETTLKITWKQPIVTNGLITGFKITYQPKMSLDSAYQTVNHGVKESIVNGGVTMTILDLLHPSTQYSVKVQARTSVGYGPATEQPCWTTIKGVHILPSVRTIDMDATNETIPIIFSTEEKSKVYKYQVIVENSLNTNGIDENLLADFEKAVVDESLPYYIAAELDPEDLSRSGQQSFVVGDRKTWGGYHNVHLNPGHAYRIRIRTVIKDNDGLKSVMSDPGEQVAETTRTNADLPRRIKILGLDILFFVLILIASLVTMCIIAFFATVVICRRQERRRKRRGAAFCNRDSGLSESLTWSVMYRASESEASGGPLVCDGWKYSSTIDKSTLKKSKTYAKNCQGIAIEDLSDYVYDPNNASRLSEEFKQLVSGQTAAWTLARKSENLKKNRYGNILPYDRCRVVLQPESNINDSDYINASFIDGYRRQKEYIITQGPLDCTIVDLWRMVWQENAPVIVMLTDQVENGKKKCSKYWPDDSMTCGNLNILNIYIEECIDFTIRTLLMRKEDEGRTHRLLHYQFTGWPDRTVPLNSRFLLKMIKRIRSDNPVLGGPMIVHCSAGAGRSGTYVALDTLIQQAQEEKQVDIFRFVNNARLQRINLVQTMEQYMFIHEALLDAVTAEDSVVPLYQVAHHLLEMRQSTTLSPKAVIRKQFQLLKHSQKQSDVNNCSVALSESNIFKNRDPMTVPADSCRIRLRSDLDSPNCFDDYINAIYVDSYRKKNCYLVTQMPLNHTVEDFWKMVYQSKSSLIVMLNNYQPGYEENVVQYWPSDGECKHGIFQIQLVSFEERNDHTIQIMKLIKQTDFSTECRKITQIQCKGWFPEQQVPDDPGVILRLLQTMELWYQRSEVGPIVIHCMDGATRCGLFCAISYVCEQIEEENVLDAQQAVKNIRSNRPEFITSLEQFVFIFEIANILGHTDYAQAMNFPPCKV